MQVVWKDHCGKNNLIKPMTHTLNSRWHILWVWQLEGCGVPSGCHSSVFLVVAQFHCAYGGLASWIRSGIGWAHNTNTTGALSPAPCGTKEVLRIRRMDSVWGGQPLRGNKREGQIKACAVNFENKVQFPYPMCNLFRCPVVRVLSSWVMEPSLTPWI